jgi:hypothetical protein
VITLLLKDDLFKYAHDCKRLFSIMYLITSKDLHYLINQALIDRDGVAWYKAIVEHVHGTTNVIGPELCGGTKTEKGKVVGWLMGSLVSLSFKLRKN